MHKSKDCYSGFVCGYITLNGQEGRPEYNIGGEGERGDDHRGLASEHFGITVSFAVKI